MDESITQHNISKFDGDSIANDNMQSLIEVLNRYPGTILKKNPNGSKILGNRYPNNVSYPCIATKRISGLFTLKWFCWGHWTLFGQHEYYLCAKGEWIKRKLFTRTIDFTLIGQWLSRSWTLEFLNSRTR